MSKRAAEVRSLDELCFFLANDTRTLVEFDRSFLLVHLGGESYCAAVGNQTSVEKKSPLVVEVGKLASAIKDHEKTVFVSRKILEGEKPGVDLTPELEEALKSYLRLSGAGYLLAVALTENTKTIGHLMMEFIDVPVPEKARVETLLTLAPVFAEALAR